LIYSKLIHLFLDLKDNYEHGCTIKWSITCFVKNSKKKRNPLHCQLHYILVEINYYFTCAYLRYKSL